MLITNIYISIKSGSTSTSPVTSPRICSSSQCRSTLLPRSHNSDQALTPNSSCTSQVKPKRNAQQQKSRFSIKEAFNNFTVVVHFPATRCFCNHVPLWSFKVTLTWGFCPRLYSHLAVCLRKAAGVPLSRRPYLSGIPAANQQCWPAAAWSLANWMPASVTWISYWSVGRRVREFLQPPGLYVSAGLRVLPPGLWITLSTTCLICAAALPHTWQPSQWTVPGLFLQLTGQPRWKVSRGRRRSDIMETDDGWGDGAESGLITKVESKDSFCFFFCTTFFK